MELVQLPGEYARPRGRLLLARANGHDAGVVALRRIGADGGELRRLHVLPDFRWGGIGRALVRRAVDEARASGLRSVRLEVMPNQVTAIRIFHEFGFAERAPYHDDAEPRLVFMERAL